MSTSFASHTSHDAHSASSNTPIPSELTAEQQKLVGDLGRKMRFVGGFFVLIGLLRLLDDILVARALRFDLTLLIDVLVGLWTLSAGRAFQQVARTRGRDIEFLMEGLGDLRKLYLLIFWLLGAASIVAGVVLLFGLIA